MPPQHSNRSQDSFQKIIQSINKTKILLTVFLSVFLFCFLSTPNQANANMFNRFKKGFYFEKYKNAKEAQKALLELHPIGSDVGELIKTLDIATGRKEIFDKSVDDLKDRLSKKGSYFYFDYISSIVPFVGVSKWVVVVDVDVTNYEVIKKIQIGSGFDAL